MEPFGNHNRLAIGGGAERSGQKGSEQKNDYFDGLNVSCNSNDCSSYFDVPDCVTDVYLQALDGGDDSFAALRQISEVYGDKEKKEYDRNCNMNNEPLPNEGCGCTGSYNGGAGAGTAVCDCDGKPYECGFVDKKRDQACCGYPNDKYRPEDVNIKPQCTQCWNKNCTCGAAMGECTCKDTYQQDLANKKPECCVDYKYVAQMPPPKPLCPADDPTCCGSCQNSRALAQQGKLPDRSTFYANDGCDCQNNNNNNHVLGEADWAELRKSAYSTDTFTSESGKNRVYYSDTRDNAISNKAKDERSYSASPSLVASRSPAFKSEDDDDTMQGTVERCNIC